MADLSLKKCRRVFCASLVFGMLLFSGCAGKKGLVREELGAHATDAEKRDLALKLFKEGAELLYVDNQAAYDKFTQASELDASLIAAHFNAGVAAEALGRLEEAAKNYEGCLAHSKEQESCLANLLLVKAKLGEIDAANKLVDQYLSEYPEAPFAQVAAAKLAFWQKDFARAEKLAREAIEREADNVEALYVMTRIFYERKLYAAAKWVAKNALEHAPAHGGLYLVLGRTYEELGQLHEALDSYALAVKYQPSEEALESYGLLLLKRGRVKEALTVLQRLAELRPGDFRNHLHLGNAYMANKMFDEAKAEYVRAQELKPEDKDVNFNLGLLFFDFKPKDLPEIDRLKTSQGYFKAYLFQSGLSKERINEVNDYLKTLGQKIEMEEYSAQAAAEVKEETPEEAVPEAPAEAPPATDQEPKGDHKEEHREELPPVDEKQEGVEEQKKKDSEQKKTDHKGKKKEEDVFDEEEEDIFEDL